MESVSLSSQAVLQYPDHLFNPEQWLAFIELPSFTRWWPEYGLTDLDLQALQVMLMSKPNSGIEIKGTGGLRKMEFLPPDWDVGEKGKLKVCFLYIAEVGSVILANVYTNGDVDHLTDTDKQALCANVERIKAFLFSKPYRCSPNLQRRSYCSEGSPQLWEAKEG